MMITNSAKKDIFSARNMNVRTNRGKAFKTTVFLAVACAFFIFSNTGCKAKKYDLSGKVNIVCTIFPLYDWTLQIIGQYFNTTIVGLVKKSNFDLHLFEPTVYDYNQVSAANILVCIGDESEAWVQEAVENSPNKDMIVIKLMDLMEQNGRLLQKTGGNGEPAGVDENGAPLGYDEHVWLSVKNAKIAVQAIADALCSLDSTNADNYRKNLEAYLLELDGIDFEFQGIADKTQNKTLIFCDRFPFRYFTNDYGFSYYAAIQDCSKQTEATPESLDFLAKKIDELGVKAVFKIDGSNEKMARAVIKNSSNKFCDIVTLDSMQTTSLRAAFEGKTYTSTMRKNIEELKKALN